MARIRTIKPQFFLNEQLACLGFADRLLFIGLWTQADKAGRLEDRPMRIKAQLFPYDDLNIDECLGRLANASLIVRYEGNGQNLIAIPTWEKHQKPHATEVESVIPQQDTVNNVYLTVTKQQEGKGTDQGKEWIREGKGMDSTALRARFERFWQSYPRKVGKDAAWALWQRKKPADDLTNQMIAKVSEQSRSTQWIRDGGQYIPHPRTWLGQGRWQDETTVSVPVSTERTERTKAALTRFVERGNPHGA